MPTSSNVPMLEPTPSDPQANNHQHSSPHADTHSESPRSSLPSPPSSPSSSFSSLPSSIFSLSLPSSPPPSPSLSLSSLPEGGRHRPEHEHEHDLEWDAARVLTGDHNINASLSFSTHISQSFVLPSLSLSLSDFERDREEDANATISIRRRERERARRRVVGDIEGSGTTNASARVPSSEGVANPTFLILGARGSGTIGVAEELVSYGNHVSTREGESERRRSKRRGERRALVSVENGRGAFEGMKIIGVARSGGGKARGYVMEFDEEAGVEDLVGRILDAIHASTIPSSSSSPIPIFTALILLISPKSSPSSSSLQTQLTPYIPIISVTSPSPDEPLTPSTLLSSFSSSSTTTTRTFSSQLLPTATPNPLHLNSEPLSPHALRHALFHPQTLAQLHESARHKLLTSSYYVSSQARTSGPTATANVSDTGKTRKRMGLHHRRSTNATITGRPTLPPPFSSGYHDRFTGSGESAISSEKSSSGSGGRSSPNHNPTSRNQNHKSPSRACVSHAHPTLNMQLDPLHIPSLLFLSFSLLKESAKTLGMHFSVFPSHYQYQHQDEGWKRERGRGRGMMGRTGWVAVTAFLSGVGVGW
ncbi:hypothetical protein M422DRAFT_31060, partial [Sphaerobolus stellatus SS14]